MSASDDAAKRAYEAGQRGRELRDRLARLESDSSTSDEVTGAAAAADRAVELGQEAHRRAATAHLRAAGAHRRAAAMAAEVGNDARSQEHLVAAAKDEQDAEVDFAEARGLQDGPAEPSG